MPGLGLPVRILWAEDNPQDQFMIRAGLEETGLDEQLVSFVKDGVEALERLAKGLPDLVVLDLKMPRVGGLEALRRIRAHPAWTRLPVTIFSAGDDPEETRRCRDLGVRDVVRKPVSFNEFLAAVQQVVRPLLATSRPEMSGPSLATGA